MIRAMIVDDNRVICEFFEKVIDWASMGIELVGITSDGMAGWQEFCRLRPEIVITDVRMPGMTGLELAKKIREKAPETAILFISNYEDFSYIREAMELGAGGYILKHEIRGKIFAEKLIQIRRELENKADLLRERRESRLIMCLSSIGSDGAEAVFPDRYGMLLTHQEDILPVLRPYSEREGAELGSGFYDDFFYRHGEGLVCCVKLTDGVRAILLKESADPVSYARMLNSEAFARCGIRCFSLLVAQEAGINECITACRNHFSDINLRYFRSGQVVFLPKESDSGPVGDTSGIMTKLKNAINGCDLDTMCAALDTLSEKCIESESIDFLSQNVSGLLDLFKSYGKAAVCSYGDEKFWTEAGVVMYWLKNKFISLLGSLRDDPVLNCSEPVRRAVEYIQDNYTNSGITICDISEHVGVTPNQLRLLMKSETGLTPMKWLTSIRMERAKELLDWNMKVSDVYPKVGYTNLSYFADAFKRACGETPVEYRRRANEKKKI
ncbi:MAG: response regulator [Oscillospiraceae bacterium]|nr:response regulator [Oscillospiraceae bacterium]